MARTKTATATKRQRSAELKAMLEERLHELEKDVQGRIRGARAEHSNQGQVVDDAEASEIDIQDEIEFALIQMKAETLNRISAALRGLENGVYGDCFECGDEISQARLRAVPFAVRCKDCEELLETAEQRERNIAQRRNASAFVFD
jgi:DnaK suppressor protein